MTDESKEEERILRTMRKPRASQVTASSSLPVVYRPPTTTPSTSASRDAHLQPPVKSPSNSTLAPSTSKPKIESTFDSVGGKVVMNHSEQIDKLKEQKRTLLGTIVSTRRDLEEVRVEIAKLKQKEDQLLLLMEKREFTVKQLDSQIEDLELAEQTDKHSTEENRRKLEEEKTRRVREENERRRKEEEEEEIKRKEAEDQRRRKMVVNSPEYVGNAASERTENRPRAATTAAVVKMAPASIPESGEGLEAEEARLMRAMTRQKPTGRQSVVKPAQVVAPTTAKAAVEPSWKEQERAREADRNQRLAEENRKKEEERRAERESEARAKNEEKNRATAIHNRDGKMHTFYTSPLFNLNFDEEVSICGDFTDWKEIPMPAELDKNFQYSISLPLTSGPHFYRFRIGGKWEVNKNYPTGVAPTGDLMNKLEI